MVTWRDALGQTPCGECGVTGATLHFVPSVTGEEDGSPYNRRNWLCMECLEREDEEE